MSLRTHRRGISGGASTVTGAPLSVNVTGGMGQTSGVDEHDLIAGQALRAEPTRSYVESVPCCKPQAVCRPGGSEPGMR